MAHRSRESNFSYYAKWHTDPEKAISRIMLNGTQIQKKISRIMLNGTQIQRKSKFSLKLTLPVK